MGPPEFPRDPGGLSAAVLLACRSRQRDAGRGGRDRLLRRRAGRCLDRAWGGTGRGEPAEPGHSSGPWKVRPDRRRSCRPDRLSWGGHRRPESPHRCRGSHPGHPGGPAGRGAGPHRSDQHAAPHDHHRPEAAARPAATADLAVTRSPSAPAYAATTSPAPPGPPSSPSAGSPGASTTSPPKSTTLPKRSPPWSAATPPSCSPKSVSAPSQRRNC